MRNEVRDELQESIGEAAFEARFKPWEKLSEEDRTAKIAIARDELLKVLDRAGYAVIKKKEET